MSAFDSAAQPAVPDPLSGPEVRPASALRRRSDVRFRVVDGEAVVVLQEAAEVMVLNDTAARLLELADGERPLAAIAAALADEFDVAPEVLREDLLAGARELAAAGLLEIAGGGSV